MREVSWRLNRTVTYWPPPTTLRAITVFLSWAAQPGAWGPSLCWDMVLIPASSLQLIWTSCRRGYIIIWRSPTSCECHICTQFNPSTVKVILWYLRLDAPVIHTGTFLLLAAWPGSICNKRKCPEKKLDGKYTKMMHAVLNKSSIKQQLYGH